LGLKFVIILENLKIMGGDKFEESKGCKTSKNISLIPTYFCRKHNVVYIPAEAYKNDTVTMYCI